MSKLNEAENDKYADLYRDGDVVRDFVVEQIIHQSYKVAKKRGDNELIQTIEQNWEKLNGVPYFHADPTPVGVLGGPGQGKTSVMIESAKVAAKIMGLNFVSDKHAIPTKNDFYFDVVTLGGALSPNSVKGFPMPATQSFTDENGVVHEEKVMQVVMPDNVTKSKYARASFILLDDAPNAHADVLTAVYDLLKPESDSAFADIYYSYTGNTGDDGAAAKKFNTAIASRCRLMYMKDNAMDFVKRIEKQYQNDIAETYIRSIGLGFIQSNSNLLNTSPLRAQQEKTQFASSRTWTQFMGQMAQALRPYVWKLNNAPQKISKEDDGRLLREINSLAVDNMGREVGKKLYSHALRVLQDADPIARQVLSTGKVTDDLKKRIKAQYTNGETAQDMDFMYAMADSLSNHAAEQYVTAFKNDDADKQKKVLDAFVQGVYDTLLSPKTPEFVQHCYQRFFNAVVAKSGNDPKFGYKNERGAMILNNVFFGEVVDASVKVPVAVADIVHLGRKTRLVDQMKNISSIRAVTSAEVSATADEAKAYQNSLDSFKPKSSQGAAAASNSNTTKTAPQPTTAPSAAPTQAANAGAAKPAAKEQEPKPATTNAFVM